LQPFRRTFRIPLVLRRTRRQAALAAVLLLISAAAAAVTAGASGPRSLAAVEALDASVLRELNALRAAGALRPLRLSRALSAAAESHSLEMAKTGYFGHDSYDGTPFQDRLLRFYRPRNRPLWAVGENLLWASRDLGARKALKLWLASPEHRANLLDPRWREVGIAGVRAAGAPGVYRGLSVIVLTVDFGVR